MPDSKNCVLCEEPGGRLLASSSQWRIIAADDEQGSAFPGFTRIIWQAHQREMSDLSSTEQQTLMAVVFEVEALMRHHLQPDKINLASLGNHVDHLHWHVIGRWRDDSHFPAPIWAAPSQTAKASMDHPLDPAKLDPYFQAIQDRFAAS
ncbi:MAG: HIT family protein [Burkholderiaceae bacterium]